MRLNNHLKHQRVSGLSILLMFAGLSMISISAQANFATPNLTSPPYTCPANHKMYAVAVNYRPYAPQSSQKLIWKAGTETKDFVFAGNKILNITFSDLVDEVNANTNPFFGSGNGSGPSDGTYNNGNENTTDAINVRHVNNSEGQKHVLDLKVNRNVSKIGYKIQDIDSEGFGVVRYRQRVDVSLNGGIFDNLSFNRALQDINSANDVITAKRLQECSQGQCVIDASWSYTKANSEVRLRHSNIDTSGISFYTNYIVGYSDFYFCLAPPKVIIKKALNGARIIDTGNNSDQFEIKATGGSVASNSFTTTGTGANINKSTSAVLDLEENESYTITEQLINGETLGDIANYDATYTCTNATTSTAVNLSSGTMTYDATTKTRSFGLSDLKYGDEITCTITNTPKPYTFSGSVFNDNGGITPGAGDPQDISTRFIGKSAYFNGVFNVSAGEKGISNPNLQVHLTDCNGTNITTTTPNLRTVSTSGTYNFTVQPGVLSSNATVCITEVEPSPWDYTVDTTPNEYEFTIKAGTVDYRTGVKDAAGNTLNLDFGEVTQNQSALVLKQFQYIHTCNDELKYSVISNDKDKPTTGFSLNPADGIKPGNCIAYKIVAYNRGHVSLTDIQITNTLQKESSFQPESTFYSPASSGIPASLYKGTTTESPVANMGNNGMMGDNGTIISNKFNLTNTSTSMTPSTETLYFNTKYGTRSKNKETIPSP